MTEQVLAEITPSPGRRAIALLLLLALGVVMIYVALTSAAIGIPLQAVFLLSGIGALVLVSALRSATARSLRLTEAGIADSRGRVLCAMSEIAAVERGAFAFKPSNGFALRLKSPAPRGWAPGLWWRFGRRLGVGGIVSSSQAKFMADMIALRLAGKDLAPLPPRSGRD